MYSCCIEEHAWEAKLPHANEKWCAKLSSCSSKAVYVHAEVVQLADVCELHLVCAFAFVVGHNCFFPLSLCFDDVH